MTTNDIPGCPYGGLLLGTDKEDVMNGKKGEDEIHGLGARDYIAGGFGSDVLYGGDGNDTLQGGTFLGIPEESSKDVLYGGAGNDFMTGCTGEDVLYGGDGNDSLDGNGSCNGSFDGTWDQRQRDRLYCGEGWDRYDADESDYVDSSCEKKARMD
jgi:Ca2+-binding RTX toxin-like protein